MEKQYYSGYPEKAFKEMYNLLMKLCNVIEETDFVQMNIVDCKDEVKERANDLFIKKDKMFEI